MYKKFIFSIISIIIAILSFLFVINYFKLPFNTTDVGYEGINGMIFVISFVILPFTYILLLISLAVYLLSHNRLIVKFALIFKCILIALYISYIFFMLYMSLE